jgi:hypothetical protein
MVHCSFGHQQLLQQQGKEEAVRLATNYFNSGNSACSVDTPKAYDPNWLVNNKAVVQPKLVQQQVSASGASSAASTLDSEVVSMGGHALEPGEAAAAGREVLEGALEDGEVLVSLADFPQVAPWRPFVQISEILLPKGLAAPPAIQVAKRARDLRDLQGSFLMNDHEKGAQGLVESALFGRTSATGELIALARAQMPLTAVSTEQWLLLICLVFW